MIHGLYAIADAAFGNPLKQALSLLEGGVKTIQLRCKDWPAEDIAEVLKLLQPACSAKECLLIVNDHPELCLLADGIHLGQEDGPLHRASLPAGIVAGRSTHDLPQIKQAISDGFDYLGFGPVFGSNTKATGYSARGLDGLRRAVVAAGDTPVVAIGGISLENVSDVQSAGAAAWAPISALVDTADTAQTTRDFISIF